MERATSALDSDISKAYQSQALVQFLWTQQRQTSTFVLCMSSSGTQQAFMSSKSFLLYFWVKSQ